ncbi:Pantothenate kinase 4 [Eumeta japonica]|uniref:Pantothenate kinase 4 n=1 Tax=Eumeta variegata TaxID=151549 RepID=A0A4C1XBG4_EUMVA|nr:Pantothenate kinase 4 [Eumeta japonica]
MNSCNGVMASESSVKKMRESVLPFVRALLLRGTSVILCANEWPALNDVTNVELEEILQHASNICPVLAAAIATGDLVVRSNGQRGPCLDFRTLNIGLCSEMRTRGVDLIVLEGMGRSLHTNFNVRLAVDSLKLAVIKNAWLAQRLGGWMHVSSRMDACVIQDGCMSHPAFAQRTSKLKDDIGLLPGGWGLGLCFATCGYRPSLPSPRSVAPPLAALLDSGAPVTAAHCRRSRDPWRLTWSHPLFPARPLRPTGHLPVPPITGAPVAADSCHRIWSPCLPFIIIKNNGIALATPFI